jgi:hypothetical protein
MSNLPTTFLTHSQRVCRLYKALFALARREHWPDRLISEILFFFVRTSSVKLSVDLHIVNVW